MNVLNFCAVFRNLSLCDKARVAFNRPQVKGRAGSPSESDKEYEEEIDEHLFLCLHSFTKDISNRPSEEEREVYFKGSGLVLGRE